MAHRPSVLAAVNKLMILDAGMVRVFGDKDDVLAEDFKVVRPAETPLEAGQKAAAVIEATPVADAAAPLDVEEGNGPDADFEGDTPPASMSLPVLALAEARARRQRKAEAAEAARKATLITRRITHADVRPEAQAEGASSAGSDVFEFEQRAQA